MRIAPVGIENHGPESLSLVVYPDPVSDKLFISMPGKAEIKSIQITDISGRIFIRQNPGSAENTTSVSCSELPSGMYYIIVETPLGRVARPFIKQ